MLNLSNKIPLLKLSLIICLLFCYFENAVTLKETRRKRDNEAILYGNQQGSPHLSVKKSGHESIESKMNMNQHQDTDLDTFPEDSEDGHHFESKRKLLKRAKRTLIKRSMENLMAPNRMLKRKKRYVDDMDPSTLERLREMLANNYDSYYSDDNYYPNFNRMYEDNTPYVVQEPIYEENRMEKRRIPDEIPEPERIAYEIVEVNGVPGMFFPFPSVLEEKQSRIRNKRNQMDENLYRSKLEKLAEMLANDN